MLSVTYLLTYLMAYCLSILCLPYFYCTNVNIVTLKGIAKKKIIKEKRLELYPREYRFKNFSLKRKQSLFFMRVK